MSENAIIRIGIDLGTTNSEIAVNKGTEIEIINNPRGDLYTPSVFGINKRGNEVVGKDAYVQLFNKAIKDEVDNYRAEIKRAMGTGEKIHFPRNNKDYTPEQISSEILKSLKNDVLVRYPNMSTLGVVITVPAFFDTVQSEATKRAGKLAGFEHIVLLQEPIAAAIAFGFSNAKNENWLVYDLGGGTFDVALISSKDGMLQVIEHGGDNLLGGKDIDTLIVERVIKPKLLEKYSFTDFYKNNPKYFAVFSRLKVIAEEAKIKLSTFLDVDVELFDLDLVDDKGKEVELYFKFKRTEFEKMIAPIVDNTITFTKEVINRSKIKVESISKVILVGAQTQTPYIKFKVEKELGIPVDSSVNPFTVVAKGAAIYALGQRIPQEILDTVRPVNSDEVRLTLNYEAMTSENEQLITGTLEIKNSANYYIKISSESGFYNSEKIKINNQSFAVYVLLEQNKTNLYWIYLLDEQGNNIKIYPNSFSITHGISIMGAPIPHTIGVIYSIQTTAKNGGWVDTCEPFFERSSIPPLKVTKKFKTIKQVTKGTDTILPIIVYEGDHQEPNLNQEVTRIGIKGSQLPINIQKGEDVEITISISESRELDVEVYLPVADLALNARIDMYSKEIKTAALATELNHVKEDINEIKEALNPEEKAKLDELVKEIEGNINDNSDTDSKQKAQRDLINVKSTVNKLKESTAFSRLKERYEGILQESKKQLSSVKDGDEKNELTSLLSKIETAAKQQILSKNEKGMEQIISQLEAFEHKVRTLSPVFWMSVLFYLESIRDSLTDQKQANQLFADVQEALNDDNFVSLKNTVIELMKLVDRDDIEASPMNIAGITK